MLKKPISALLFSLFAFLSFLAADEPLICGKTVYASLDNCEQFLRLQIFDIGDLKESLIEELLALRRPWIVDPDQALPDFANLYGFLLFDSTPQKVKNYLGKHKGKILAAYLDEELVGYLALTDATGFTDFYRNTPFTTADGKKSLDINFLHEQAGFIGEIGVKVGYKQKGIGSFLIKAAKNLHPKGLIADIFIHPLLNKASLAFFSKKEFQEIGILYQQPVGDWTAYQSKVIYWKGT